MEGGGAELGRAVRLRIRILYDLHQFLVSGIWCFSDPGSGMNIPDHISGSLLYKETFGLKNTYLNSLMWIRDLFDPGSRIRDGKIRTWDPV
jgi:hypothetical protein